MDLTWMKDAGLPAGVSAVVVLALVLGQKLIDMFTARINTEPAMAQARAAMQVQSDTAAGSVLQMVMSRLAEIEKQLAAEAAAGRECERRYAALDRRCAGLEAVLRDHKITLPPDVG